MTADNRHLFLQPYYGRLLIGLLMLFILPLPTAFSHTLAYQDPTVTYYSSDYEGLLEAFVVTESVAGQKQFVTLAEASSSADMYLDHNGEFVLADGITYIFGGDLFDRGPDDKKLLHLLLNARKRYGDRVVLIGGNRDYNKLRWPLELVRHPDMQIKQLLSANGINNISQHWTKGQESQREALIDWLLSDEMLEYLAMTVIAHWHENSRTLIHHGDFNLQAFAHIPDQGIESIAQHIKDFNSSPWDMFAQIDRLNEWKQRAMIKAVDDLKKLKTIAVLQREGTELDSSQQAFISPENTTYPELAFYAGAAPMPKTVPDGTWPSGKHMNIPEWVDREYMLASPPRVKSSRDNTRTITDDDGLELMVTAGIENVLVGHTPQGNFPNMFNRTSDRKGVGKKDVWFIFADTSYVIDKASGTERRPVVKLSHRNITVETEVTVPVKQVKNGLEAEETIQKVRLHFDSAQNRQSEFVGKLALSIKDPQTDQFRLNDQRGNPDAEMTDPDAMFPNNYIGMAEVEESTYSLMTRKNGRSITNILVSPEESQGYDYYEPVKEINVPAIIPQWVR